MHWEIYYVHLQSGHVKSRTRFGTNFQAEIYAILACVNSLHTEYEASIAIRSDSQAALKALDTVKTTSKLVAETMTELKRLSLFYSIRLIWVPGHFNVPGNEIADKLANKAACKEFIGAEPSTHVTDGQTDRRTDRQNYNTQDCASMAVSCSKKQTNKIGLQFH